MDVWTMRLRPSKMKPRKQLLVLPHLVAMRIWSRWWQSVACLWTYTVMRWVRHYTPEFEKRWRRYALAVGQSWRVDEAYVTIRGE